MLSDIHQPEKDSRWLAGGAWLALGGGLLTSTWAGWQAASTIPEQTWLASLPADPAAGCILSASLAFGSAVVATPQTSTIGPPAWRWT